MAKNFEHLIHKNSNVVVDGAPKLPTSSQIEYGELAVNYAKDKETISLKNANNEIVTFSSDAQIQSFFKETEEIIANALNDINARLGSVNKLVEDNELVAASALNDLDKRITETNSSITELGGLIDEIDEVTASSLNDLNGRIINLEDDVETVAEELESDVDQINTRLTTLENAPSGDANVIETVKVNGTALVPDTDKAVNVTVPTETSVSGWGFTKNTGTVTGVKMNGTTNNPTNGVVDLGTVITSHQDISGKADKSAAIGSLSLSLNNTNYQITLSGTKVDGTAFSVSDVIDLPLESVVVSGSYNDSTKKVVLTLQNGSTVDFSVADLVAGLQSEITSTNKLSADLISDGTTNKTVTATEKSTWNGKQDALSNANVLSGITSTKVSNWDGAATNSHTHSNKSVLDGISSTDISNWNSKTDNVGTVTGVKMNGTTNNPTDGVVDLGTVITSETQLRTLTSGKGNAVTDISVSGHLITITKESRFLDSETQLSKGTTTGDGNAVTDISVRGHEITLAKGSTFLTSHQSIKTLNGTALTGTGDITLTGVPAFSASDNGKILGVVNGALAWVTPSTIYTGTGTPSSTQGNDGDIYLQTS